MLIDSLKSEDNDPYAHHLVEGDMGHEQISHEEREDIRQSVEDYTHLPQHLEENYCEALASQCVSRIDSLETELAILKEFNRKVLVLDSLELATRQLTARAFFYGDTTSNTAMETYTRKKMLKD